MLIFAEPYLNCRKEFLGHDFLWLVYSRCIFWIATVLGGLLNLLGTLGFSALKNEKFALVPIVCCLFSWPAHNKYLYTMCIYICIYIYTRTHVVNCRIKPEINQPPSTTKTCRWPGGYRLDFQTKVPWWSWSIWTRRRGNQPTKINVPSGVSWEIH